MSLQQILAPQLQQSLHLLQVPTLELRSLVQEELQQNPLLEEIPKDEPTVEVESPEGEVVRMRRRRMARKAVTAEERAEFKEEFEVLRETRRRVARIFFADQHGAVAFPRTGRAAPTFF